MIAEWLFSLPLATIKQKSDVHQVDPSLVASIVWQESHGRVYAARYEPGYRWTYNVQKFANMNVISIDTEQYLQSQSYGLMQIMGGTARYLGFSGPLPSLFKPDNNLFWGIKYLKSLIDRYDTIEDAVSAYNQGSPRRSESGAYKNQHYVNAVMGFYKSAKMH